MTRPQLRPYQQRVKDEILHAWQSHQAALAVMPTGAGKTTLFSDILAESNEYRIAIAHRSELVTQMSLTLARYGVRHRIVGAQTTAREAVRLHMSELGHSYYDATARCAVASVDTLVRIDPRESWAQQTKLVVLDEAHHASRRGTVGNKWISATEMFPGAKILGVTATPFRADGAGLGRHADGIFDAMIVGPTMRELIDTGSLCEYRIFAPPSQLDLSGIATSASGDFSPAPLRDAVRKAHITGDIVSHYLKIARGKLAICFNVDIESAVEAAEAFRAGGVPAEVISGKTPADLRNAIMRKFRAREILVLCNCDVLGEGTDVPAVECVIMARPTQSRGLFIQQFGRALRPMDGKDRALILDAVGNTIRHGLPDAPLEFTLDRRERRSKGAPDDAIPLRSCTNPDVLCAQVYERFRKACPHCGYTPEPAGRSSPVLVDGDIYELDAATLAVMRGAIDKIDGAPNVSPYMPPEVAGSVRKQHYIRQEAQRQLRDTLALWGGVQTAHGRDLSEAHRRFWFRFGTDVGTAQGLNARDAEALTTRVRDDLIKLGVQQ